MWGILLSAAGLLFFSSQAMEAASAAARVFVSSVLPALFPMMVLNNLSAALRPRRAFSRPGEAAVTVAFSFLAGSPASAQRLREVAARCRPSPRFLYALAGASGVMSPLFIVGSLGKAVGPAAWRMLAAHWAGALLTGGLTYLCFDSFPKAWQASGPAPAPSAPDKKQAPPSLAAALPPAIAGAAQALLAVCGAMMLFSIGAAVLQALIALAFPQAASLAKRPLAVLWALLEVGGGAFGVLAAYPQPPPALLCALCGFGGLSIWLQNLLFLGKSIRPGALLFLRGIHGAASYALCELLLKLFPV